MYPRLKTTLYHGSISEITAVQVSAGKRHKDFGRGFYMAVTKSQAVGMMHKKYHEALRRNRNQSGAGFQEYIYEIQLEEALIETLNIKMFESADIEWLDFILYCRAQGDMPHNYDLVAGPTADDDTNLCLKAYEEGLYGDKNDLHAKQILLENLEVGNLGIQYYIGKQSVADQLIKNVKRIDWR